MTDQIEEQNEPQKDEKGENSYSESQVEIKEWKEYFMPATLTKFMGKRFGLFAAIVGFYYIIQFMMAVCACNFFSDISRFNNCARADGTTITGNDASAVYDMAIYLTGIFHVMEWIRTTVLLTVVCVGANLMPIWYVSAVSAFYGIAVFIYAHVIYASADSKAC